MVGGVEWNGMESKCQRSHNMLIAVTPLIEIVLIASSFYDITSCTLTLVLIPIASSFYEIVNSNNS